LKRGILFVSGGLEAVPGIRQAVDMGLHVVVSDANPEAPGFAYADGRLLASTYDIEATVQAAEEYHREVHPLDGVLCVAADVPVTVAAVAERLGLPGIGRESAQRAVDKLAMKDRFSRDGVAIPEYAPVADAEAVRAFQKRFGPMIVIKPVDSRGARGVLRLGPGADIDRGFAFARAESPTGRVMVERFLPGPQVSTESLVINGVAHTPGFSDRNYALLERYAPHMIEDGGGLPSHLEEDIQAAVRALVQQAAESLGIRNGVVKGDIVVSEGVPHVIELAARLSGGYFCTHEIPLNTGVDLVGAAIRSALGESVDAEELEPRFLKPVCQRYLFPEPGVVEAVEGFEEVARRPGIALCEIRVRPGDRIGPVNAHPARAGVIIATGTTRDEAQQRAAAAVRDIRITTRATA